MSDAPKPIRKYEREFPAGSDPLSIELLAYRYGWSVEDGGLGKYEHLKRIIRVLWGPENKVKHFIFTPEAEEMLKLACEYKYLGVSGFGSSGKCLAPYTEVLFFDGSVGPASSVQIGDQLMGDDSTPRTVLSVNRGRSNMVGIIPEKGDPWDCNDDHMLTLKRAWSGKKCWRRVGEVIDISVKDYLASSDSFKARFRMFCAGVEFPYQPIDFDPYMYGLWLGDGSKGRPMITSSDREVEVNAKMRVFAEANGYDLRRLSYKNRCPGYSFATVGKHNNDFLNIARESCGMAKGEPGAGKKKRILPRYLINTREVRMQVLAGLIDSDGYASGTYFEIASSTPELTDDIAYLARSLGFRVTVTPRNVGCNGRKCLTFRINVLGDTPSIPTARKKCSTKKLRKNSDCTAFEIQQLGEGDWCGFTLDGNGRFLLGDFTVTHNTDSFAVKAIVDYICAPSETLILLTSTSLKEARKRIWGAVLDYWRASPGLPGKVVDSSGQIRFQVGEHKGSDRCGIALIAGEKKNERENVAKLIGLKQKRVGLVGDEMPELSEAILEASYNNLSLNPEFYLHALGNFKSIFDAFGNFIKPKQGWASVSVEDRGWETDRGYCLHLDALKSSNWLAGENLYPIIKVETIRDAIEKDGGANSPGFWRMFRSFPCPGGSEHSIYSEADLIKFSAEAPPIWDGEKTRIAALDPSFTSGGDRAPLIFGNYGKDTDGRWVICPDKVIYLQEDAEKTKAGEPRNYQIAQQIKEHCEAEGVLPRNFALDSTGAGSPFADIVGETWSREILRVQFGGAASELPFSALDPTPMSKRCVNRVTELWVVGTEFLRNRQFKGIFPELARELCAREYTTEKTGQMRMRAESKEDMRARMGKSPDLGDAWNILVDLCRQRLGAIPGGSGGMREASTPGGTSWKRITRKFMPRMKALQR